MKILAADIGNSHITLGAYDQETLVHEWRIASRPFRTADEYLAVLSVLFDHNGFRPERMITGSVVPPLEGEWEKVAETLKIPLRIIRPLKPDLLPLHVDTPEEVGVDRIINSWAALQKFDPPLLIIDFGTATTFDLVGCEGDYCGGIILPGLELVSEALFRRTALLPQVSIRKPPSVIGRNTIDCIRSGLYFGWLDMTHGLIERIKSELKKDVCVIVTGGFSAAFGQDAAFAHHIMPTLTLDGLHGIDMKWDQYMG